jgi:sugar lactone lactonase YvrE
MNGKGYMMTRNQPFYLLALFFLLIGCSIEEDEKESTSYRLKTEVWPSDQNGKIIPSQGDYNPFTVKTIYARPDPGWVFDRWEGAINGSDNPTAISFYDNLAIRAVFTKDTFNVRTIAGGQGKGSQLNQLYYPTGIALDPSGDLYVSDMYNHRIQRWKPGATVGITAAGGNGFGYGASQLEEPGKIDIDSQGNLFIADTGNNRIQKWEYGGLTGFTVAGGNGMGNELNQLNKPFGIAVDNAGAIYISELGNHRVTKWSKGASKGELVAGGNGEGSNPNQLSIPMGIAVNNKGDVFVADTYNHRIQLWEQGATKGRTLISGKDFKPDSQINYFSGISLVNDSYLYITDYQQKRIIRYDLETDTFKIISTNETIENEEDKLSQPYQTAVDIMGDLIIADAKNNRIQKRKIENE